jgi:DNA-binding beta-propeller fold protein YncE
VDPEKLKVVARVPVGPDAHEVVASSDGKTAYASNKEVKRVNNGHGAAGILMSADGSRAFVGCTVDNYIAVLDLKTLEVTGHIEAGGRPDGLAWAVQRP